MSDIIGFLKVELLHATLTHDTKTVARMDPYATFKVQNLGFEWKSDTIKNGSTAPKWENAKF